MKNLIIHPDDRSTDFLKRIYSTAEKPTVLSEFPKDSVDEIPKEIMHYDRVMMMGHGTPDGLFAMNADPIDEKAFELACKSKDPKALDAFDFWGDLVVSDRTARVLRYYNDNIFIWCNANKFVKEHNLKGFYSGMFISEVSEAKMCGLGDVPKGMVRESNRMFSRIMSRHINEKLMEMFKNVVVECGNFAMENPVAKYNWDRLGIST